MSSSSELSSFAARLRESILTSEWGARTSSGSNPKAFEADFEGLALQLFALQFTHNAAYRRLCEARGVRPEAVAHWTDIPTAPTSAFKELDLSCLPVAERTAVFHSSGTTEQKPSRHYHNAASLALYEASLLRWFGTHCQLPIANCQLAILTPPPAQAPHSSLVHMFETIRRKYGRSGSAFVGKVAKDGAWALELEAAVEALRKASDEGQSLLMPGTAFSFVHLLDSLAEQDLRFDLPPGSCALETGGYKGRSRSLSKAALHALISERLGIPPGNIICEYGMSELSSQAYESAVAPSRNTQHAPRNSPPFHFPPWARVQVVSPETGCEVDEGETGLIRVYDLANVCSVMAIQTEDLGIWRADGFALAGRAALAEPRGCSLTAV
jgi:hypothetical protein